MKRLLQAYTYQNSQLDLTRTQESTGHQLNPLTTSDRKQIFLQRLRPASGGKNQYKRYISSPLWYAGGKTLAVGLIIELIPDNIKRLISPFLGGGSVEIAVAKELDIPVKALISLIF